jgi:hypothetical protein
MPKNLNCHIRCRRRLCTSYRLRNFVPTGYCVIILMSVYKEVIFSSAPVAKFPVEVTVMSFD